ncbi:MAG: hypothetical protein HC904_07480 [Blastochloris sp.]|nr:hypothetical protein [Blastochloris sp.]
MEFIYAIVGIIVGIVVWILLQLLTWSVIVRTAEQARQYMTLVGVFAVGALALVLAVSAIIFVSEQQLSIVDLVVLPVITAIIFLTSLASLAVLKKRRE